MTYCVGLRLKQGLVFLADTRTNAGVDHVSRYRKLFTWRVPGERALALMTAGNLSITQGVVTRLNRAIKRDVAGEGGDGDEETILNADSLYRVAQIVGEAMFEQQQRDRAGLEAEGASSDASLILGGQRRGGRHRLFLIYSAGNFIEATSDTPYFQIGEFKYGKPILDRVVESDTPIEEALQAAFVSMDSTLRSNLSVGMPLDLAVIREGQFGDLTQRRITSDDEDFARISSGWSQALREAFDRLPSASG